MQPTLSKRPFTPEDLDGFQVQEFDCGNAPYEREVSAWLKGRDAESASASILDAERPAKVWLYKSADGTLVGFGAIAPSKWRWTSKKDPYIPITVIIWVGLQRQFQGKPDGPRNGRYSVLIVNDLIKEAEAERADRPVLGLAVHKDNERAIKLYRSFGFTDNLEPMRNKTTKEVEYLKMAIVLDDAALLRVTESCG